MDLSYNAQHVIESLTNKLAQAEKRASEFEAVTIAKEQKIVELEEQLTKPKEEAE